MPLKFRCACGKVLKVPDSMEGQWVRCPGCQGMSPVADFVRAEPKPLLLEPTLVPEDYGGDTQHEMDKSLEVVCACGKLLQVPEVLDGQWVRCPACKRMTPAADFLAAPKPLPPTIIELPDALEPPPKKKAAKDDDPETLELVCDCGKVLRVPPNAAGKRYRCPKCKAVLTDDPPSEEEVLYVAEVVPDSESADVPPARPRKRRPKRPRRPAYRDLPDEDEPRYRGGGIAFSKGVISGCATMLVAVIWMGIFLVLFGGISLWSVVMFVIGLVVLIAALMGHEA